MSSLTSDPEEPITFNETRNLQDPENGNLWREAIKKEQNSFESKKEWTEKQKNEIPMSRRLVGSKWVFKVQKMEHTEQH